jgi:hypothetical protein
VKRFRPYFGLIKALKWPLIGGALFTLIYAVASGFSLPYAIAKIFPKVLNGIEHYGRDPASENSEHVGQHGQQGQAD